MRCEGGCSTVRTMVVFCSRAGAGSPAHFDLKLWREGSIGAVFATTPTRRESRTARRWARELSCDNALRLARAGGVADPELIIFVPLLHCSQKRDVGSGAEIEECASASADAPGRTMPCALRISSAETPLYLLRFASALARTCCILCRSASSYKGDSVGSVHVSACERLSASGRVTYLHERGAFVPNVDPLQATAAQV